MDYEEFLENVKSMVEDRFFETHDMGRVLLRSVVKNNNVKMQALSIISDGDAAAPTIYLEEYYDDYNNGRDLESICDEIIRVYDKNMDDYHLEINPDDLFIFDRISERIFYKLVNYGMNVETLGDIPHYKYLDMAIVFYIMLSDNDQGQATALIHTSHLSCWGVDLETLRDIAYANTWRRYPAVIQKMEDVISQMVIDGMANEESSDRMMEEVSFEGYADGDDLFDLVKEEVVKIQGRQNMQMYVLSNNIKTNGAACLTYPGVLEDFARENDTDVYVIPSSVHEVILVTGQEWMMEKLDAMVVEVNETELNPVEILSNHAYVYKKDIGRLTY